MDVVMGCGTPLMGDDGVGLVALERLRGAWSLGPGVELVDGGTWGMTLLPVLDDARRILILDAVDVGAAPGTLVRLEREAIPRMIQAKLSPHQIDLREVLALAELRGTLPEDTTVLGVQPGRVELDAGLSLEVAATVPELLEAVAAHLRGWGHQVSEREAEPCTS